MQKIKTMNIQKNGVNSPSPDSKSPSSVKPTNSPVHQIQKYLAINHHQSKVKKQISLTKIVGSNLQISNEKQEQYKLQISNLEQQISQYKIYINQYQQLANKNKKLEQQMFLILQQLQSRYRQNNRQAADAQSTPTPKNRVVPLQTQQSSTQQNQSYSYNRYAYQTKLKSPSRDEQMEYLYQYIDNLQETMKGFMNQCKQMEGQIRKNVKKDLNQMEQRLMSYIFGLQERVSEATFRNNDIMRKLSTARERQQEFFSYSKRSQRSDQYLRKKNSGQYQDSGNSIFKLSPTDRKSILDEDKKDSVVSLMNMEVNNSANDTGRQQAKIIKNLQQDFNQQQDLQPQITIKKCQKCTQYLQKIEQLSKKCQILQQDLNRSQGLIAINEYKRLSNSLQSNSQQQNGKNVFKIKQSQLQILQEVVQQSYQQSSSRARKQPKQNSRQSHINIVVEFSQNDNQSQKLSQKSQQVRSSRGKQRQSFKKSQKSKAQKILKMQRLKQQLINIMQQIQELVHQCQSVQNNSLLSDMNKKIREQAQHITQLEQQIFRLKMEIQEGKADKQNLLKLVKMQQRQQQGSSSYFKPIVDPISCIDHTATKSKIDQIINSIKKFEMQVSRSKKEPDVKISQSS